MPTIEPGPPLFIWSFSVIIYLVRHVANQLRWGSMKYVVEHCIEVPVS